MDLFHYEQFNRFYISKRYVIAAVTTYRQLTLVRTKIDVLLPNTDRQDDLIFITNNQPKVPCISIIINDLTFY